MRPNRKNTNPEPKHEQIHLTEIIPLNNVQREMQSPAARSYTQSDFPETPFPRQEFRRAHTSVGAAGGYPAGHILRLGGLLAPLVVGEFVKDPDKRWRWIRICSLVAAGTSEILWAHREQQRREEREAERCR
jgi:hypothetical protein